MKKIKFPLEMADGKMVRELEEFRQYFDLELALEYFNNGKLQTWLANGYNDDILEELQDLDIGQPDFLNGFLDALGVEKDAVDTNISTIIQKIQLKEKLKRVLPEEQLEQQIDSSADSQELLDSLLRKKIKKIYLVGGSFHIPASITSTVFIGLDKPKVFLEEHDRGRFLRQDLRFQDVIPGDPESEALMNSDLLGNLALSLLDILETRLNQM